MRKGARAGRIGARRDAGVSLAFIMLVVGVVGFTMMSVIPMAAILSHGENLDRLQDEIYDIAAATQAFWEDNQAWPTDFDRAANGSAMNGLDALVRRPDDLATWRGPYYFGRRPAAKGMTPGTPLDPWGNRFLGVASDDGRRFVVICVGADGEVGTADDVPRQAVEILADSDVLEERDLEDRVKRRLTLGHLRRLNSAVDWLVVQTDGQVTAATAYSQLGGMIPGLPPVDGWGNSWVVEGGGATVSFYSAGPDGQSGTVDDLWLDFGQN